MNWMILPFKRYAEFSGRSRRMEFWMFQLLNIIVALVLAGPLYFSRISAAMVDPSMAGEGGEAAMAASFADAGSGYLIMAGLYGLYALAALVPTIAVTVRRLHDRDMSGWWYLGFVLLALIPILVLLASLAFLIITFLPGTLGPNRFGEDPKDPMQASVFE
jgi:uncharacterized membrane protein YhaH (DUF805 family)